MAPRSDDDDRQKIFDSLKRTLDEAEWAWLEPHQERGCLLIVAAGLDLLDIGFKIAIDDKDAVQAWISSGRITRPTADQLAQWKRTPDKKFLTVVVQPYVLAQEHLLH